MMTLALVGLAHEMKSKAPPEALNAKLVEDDEIGVGEPRGDLAGFAPKLSRGQINGLPD
jgi:hypothetical protein